MNWEKFYDDKFMTVEKLKIEDYNKLLTENLPYRFEWIINQINKLNNKNLKILDIGCNQGILLSALKKEGYNNLTGIDVSKTEIKHSKTINPEIAFKYMSYKDIKENYDVIIATEVLEHIEDPKDFIKKIFTHSNKLVLITTPIGFNHNTPEHLHHFDVYNI